MTPKPTNWAGNVTFTADRVVRPTSVDQLREVVASNAHVHAVGTGHSFSRVADSAGVLVSVADLPRTVEFDTARAQVRVDAGSRYGELSPMLHDAGFALHNLGSLPHISVAGACATGTHGSGTTNGGLSTAVAELEMVTADGGLLHLDRTDPRFAGAVVALGALGVVTHLVLDVEATYDVRQVVFDRLPWVVLLDNFDAVMTSGDSVSLFTRWQGDAVDQAWVKQRVGSTAEEPDLTWAGAVPADGPRHPVAGMPVTNCTEQSGVRGPWFDRLPHFRLGFTPSSGEELQSEFLLPLAHAVEALEAVRRLRDIAAPVLQVSEIRTVAADDLWLSPTTGRASVAIHFTWVADTAAVLPVVRAIEDALGPFDARPHWGKVFTSPLASVRRSYPRLVDFAELARELDPDGVFRNDVLEELLDD